MAANWSARLLDKAATAIEEASWLDPVSAGLQKVTTPLRRFAPVTSLLSGTPLGHPLHPLLVTVPIGGWSGALVLDVLGNRKGARTLVGVGVVSAAPTVLSGLSDWRDTDGAEARVGVAHALANAAAVTCYAGSWLARRRGHHVRGIAWTLPGLAFVSFAGWLGGHLSYARGVGVDTTAFQSGQTDGWVDVDLRADEVREGELSATTVGQVAVVVSRIDGEVVAYADRCTHRGGPLHEGTVVDGCVQCPWHEARYSLRDGSVAQGPATRPQPVYDVRVEAGALQLRRDDEPRTLATRPV